MSMSFNTYSKYILECLVLLYYRAVSAEQVGKRMFNGKQARYNSRLKVFCNLAVLTPKGLTLWKDTHQKYTMIEFPTDNVGVKWVKSQKVVA